MMDFGSLGHAMLLGEDDQIDIGEFKDFRTDAAKLWRDASLSKGRIPALKHVAERAALMRTMALAYIDEIGFGKEFAAARNEVTVIGKIDGSYCRARFDKLLIDPEGSKDRQHSEIAVAFDVKITADAAPEKCQRQIGDMGYDLQKKFYLDTLSAADKRFAGKTRWIFFFIENEFPFCVTAVEIGNLFGATASKRFERGFQRWKRGIQTGDWPTYMNGQGAFTIDAPVYLQRKELEEEAL